MIYSLLLYIYILYTLSSEVSHDKSVPEIECGENHYLTCSILAHSITPTKFIRCAHIILLLL